MFLSSRIRSHLIAHGISAELWMEDYFCALMDGVSALAVTGYQRFLCLWCQHRKKCPSAQNNKTVLGAP